MNLCMLLVGLTKLGPKCRRLYVLGVVILLHRSTVYTTERPASAAHFFCLRT